MPRRLPKWDASLLLGDRPQSGEHRARQTGAAINFPFERWRNEVLRDGDNTSRERVSQPRDIGEQSLPTRQLTLEGRLRENRAGAAAGAAVKAEVQGRIINSTPIDKKRFVVTPARLPGNRVIRFQSQSDTAHAGRIRRIGRSADGRRIELRIMESEIAVIARGEIRGDAKRGGDFVDQVLLVERCRGSVKLLASIAARNDVAEAVGERIQFGIVYVHEAG